MTIAYLIYPYALSHWLGIVLATGRDNYFQQASNEHFGTASSTGASPKMMCHVYSSNLLILWLSIWDLHKNYIVGIANIAQFQRLD